MEKYRGGKGREHESEPEDRIEIDKGEWWWVSKGGRWQTELLQDPPRTPEGYKERDRRDAEVIRMMRELREQTERHGAHNEGFLRDHPRYEELFVKWAIRYLRNKKGFNVSKYNGQVSNDGYLLDNDGRETSDKLTDLVRSARDWIDDFIACELQVSEEFVDITHDYEKREQLDIYPANDGWYNRDQW